MKRILVMSDIHGEYEKFEKLLKETAYNPSEDQLILLGDYVDRGPDARAVVEKVKELKAQGAIALKGNHEDMMEKAFADPTRINHWFINGGMETLKSYGYTFETDKDIEQWVSEPLIKNETIEAHLAFINELGHFHETEDTIFVHGGVHPDTPVSETDPHILMWIRDEFHKGYKGEKTVVFGHTPTEAFHDSFDIYFGDNNIIGIDGGCVYGGQLNSLELPSKKVYCVKE
ncbi:metallophosphoesterase family protein [Camelliibacillus cellulosilyticus]|uniref:Metallophosphoesterase family protein n=1 Tax=Camelliibacillus cellulosilyticus TaxID=2174486 RepID=A0ABV9GP14_9BACL